MKADSKKILFMALSCGLALLLSGCHLAILDPKGIIALKEKHLLVGTTLLMLIVVIPVILLSFFFAWRYRSSKNRTARYNPHWGHSNLLELVCWSIPLVIIVILAMVTWVSTHRLDPYRPLDVKGKPLVIQAVALEWKWLFIYPEQKIATVNLVQMPVNRPIRFIITSDAPMNSFAIPRLAGQIYAMAGMKTRLNLLATETGDYRGLSTNFSGDGFSGMHFVARVSTQQDFNKWVDSVRQAPKRLTLAGYNQLVVPSENNRAEYFASVDKGIFNQAVMKYMRPGSCIIEGNVKQPVKNKSSVVGN